MTDDRTPFREARDAGLVKRHEQRLARAATRDDCTCRTGFFDVVNPTCPQHAGPSVVAIWEMQNTYPPDATECNRGHRFASEADCVLPEGWDNFMCRTCINETVAKETP